jgi:hypothetical protein
VFTVLDLVSIVPPEVMFKLTGHSYLLVRHPNTMSKLRSEIASVLGGKDVVTRGDLKQLEFLTNVLKESSYLVYSYSR